MNNDILRYGEIKADIETKENGYHRIRVIRYGGKIYIHHMFNGKIIECHEV